VTTYTSTQPVPDVEPHDPSRSHRPTDTEHSEMIEHIASPTHVAHPPLLERRIDATSINLEWVAYGALFIFSILIHFWNLGVMAMAHDESIHAWTSWRFFVGRGGFTCAGGLTAQTYCYDPVYHGPTLYFLTAAGYFLFGVSDTTARLPQTLAGIALIPAVYLLRPLIGKRAAFIAAVLVTLSPSMLYFSRYARHDALMLLWTLLMFAGLFRWLRFGRTGDLVLAAVSLALGWATHELVFIVLFIGGTFLIFRGLWEWHPTINVGRVHDWRPNLFAIAVATGLGVSAAIIAANVLATDPELQTRLERLLGPALMAGVGSLLVVALTRTWPSAPVMLGRLHDTWDARGNARPDRPRTFMGRLPAAYWWAIAAFLVTFGLLFSTFLAYPRGFLDGFYQGIKYWWFSQHDYARGGQPWFYYLMLLPIYDLLALLFAAAGIGWLAWGGRRSFRRSRPPAEGEASETAATYEQHDTVPLSIDDLDARAAEVDKTSTRSQRTDLFLGFLAYWSVLSLIAFSWAGEKMPWLVIQISLPLTLLAAWVLARLIRNTDWSLVRRNYGWSIPLLVTVALVVGGVAMYYLTGAGETQNALQDRLRALPALGMFGIAIFGLITVAGNVGARNVARVAALTAAGLLLLYGVNSAVQVVYLHPDTPVEPLIYTQTSPDVPVIVEEIKRTAISQTRNDRSKEDPVGGLTMPISVDKGLAWPFQWYLRDFRSVSWVDLDQNEPTGLNTPAVLLMVNQETAEGRTRLQTAREDLEITHVKLSESVLNWWFPEGAAGCESGYPSDPNGSCAYKDIGNRGPLGVLAWPFQPSNWPALARFMVYRDIPHELNGREFDFYLSRETAPVAGGTSAPSAQNVTQPMQVLATWGAGELSGPRGMTTDAQGNVYVADALNHRVVVFDTTGAVVRTFGTKGGGDGQLYEPSGVSVDADGNVYVADTWNARITKWSADGTWIASWGSGRDDFGEGRRATDTNGDAQANADNPLGFYGPRNVLVVNDRVYIADTGNKRIVVTDLDGNFVEQWGTWGAGEGQFHEPIGLGVDGQGRIYVGDTWNSRVQIFNRTAEGGIDTAAPTVVRVSGWEPNTYNDPYMTVAPDGRILVALAGRNAVGVYSAAGTLEARLRAEAEQMGVPKGLAVAADGGAYVTDGDGKVLKFQLP
jgi:uncharacterized protein (TIGR03663 family)